MTRAQALKEAQRRWGKQAMIDDRGARGASTPERRAAASAELKTLRANKPQPVDLFDTTTFPDEKPIGEFRAARRAYMKASQEYRETEQRLQSECFAQRYRIGRDSFAFEIKGSGDTWEECFADADARAAADKERYARPAKRAT